jgi:hypothetical protein
MPIFKLSNYYLFIALSLIIFSCNKPTNEQFFLQQFKERKAELNRLNSLIDSLVIPKLDPKDSSYSVTGCDKSSLTVGSKYCDSTTTRLMKELGISTISIEKGPCSSGEEFKRVIYSLNNKYSDVSSYYYYHDLCDMFENRFVNSMSIPLENHWSLFINTNKKVIVNKN